jgi:hypothetical protein
LEKVKQLLTPTIARLRDLDSRAWSTATWAAPFIIQLVLAAMIIVLCLSGKVPPYVTNSSYSGGPAWFLAIAAVTTLVSVPISGLLLRSRSSRVRGMALSVMGSAAIVLIGAIAYAFCVIRW